MDDRADSLPRGGCTKGLPGPVIKSSMVIAEVLRVCVWDSAFAVEGRTSVSTTESVKARWRGCMSDESEKREPALLDQVLKCAGGGRDPVGRGGRFVRRSWR